VKIIQLTAENVKRLEAVDITPDDHMVIVSGRNGQGKTSVLDAIWLALGGRTATKSNPAPVRRGSTSARVRIDLGDLVVTRTWNADAGTTSLRVENAEGNAFAGPQGVLDSLVGRLSFDPLAFANLGPREQRDTLIGLIELPFDLDEMDRRRQDLYDQRTNVNRGVRELSARISAAKEALDIERHQLGGPLPEVELDLGELMSQMREANQRADRRRVLLADAASMQQRADRLTREREDALAEIVRLRARVAELDEDIVAANAEHDALHAKRDAIEAPDLVALEESIQQREVVNGLVRRVAELADMATAQTELQAEADTLTREMDAIDTEKSAALAAAKMPVPGLGFDVDGVSFNGTPFVQCSSAEQLRISMAMAMAMNPRVRVIRIKDGSLLDAESMTLVAELALEHDFQVWIERVADHGGVGIVIEDGRVELEP
jgi:DNA repair exonuclease SbcCD ATPase subunit